MPFFLAGVVVFFEEILRGGACVVRRALGGLSNPIGHQLGDR
jgi:hypothetical protein